jgi:hypothetical protein
MTPFLADKRREEFIAILAEIGNRYKAAAAIELPSYWEHPRCGCGEHTGDDPTTPELKVVTEGYEQCCRVDEDVDHAERSISASTDGWDDMSEDGNVSYLYCMGCGAIWALPEEMGWN